MVGTLSQSDYMWGHSANQITGARRVCMRRGCACRGCARRGCACSGVRAQGMCTQGVCMQGWLGHSANQITGGDTQPIRLQVCTEGTHTGGVHADDARTGGACAGGARAGDVRTGGACTGVVGTLSQSDYRWGHSANQITGACRGCAHRGCVHRGCACRGCTHRGCVHRGCAHRGGGGHSANQITGGDTQPIRLQVHAGGARAGVVGTLSQSDYTGLRTRMHVQGLCAGGVHTGGACKGVVGTLSQSDYTGLRVQGVHAQGWWGHLANQITQGCAHRGCARRGCACRGGGDT